MERTHHAIPFGVAGLFVAIGLVFAVLLGGGSTAQRPAYAGGNEKPVITTFNITARGTKSDKFSNSTTLNVELVSTDDVRVMKWFICDGCTEPPVAGSGAWFTSKPLKTTIFSGNGPHTLRAWVQDGSENISKPVADKIFYDSVKPNHSIDFPNSQQHLNKLTRIGGKVNEFLPSSGLASAEYSILRRKDCSWWDPETEAMVKGKCGDPALVAIAAPVTAKTYSADIGTLDEPGTYSLTVRLVDRAGNVALRTQKFFID